MSAIFDRFRERHTWWSYYLDKTVLSDDPDSHFTPTAYNAVGTAVNTSEVTSDVTSNCAEHNCGRRLCQIIAVWFSSCWNLVCRIPENFKEARRDGWGGSAPRRDGWERSPWAGLGQAPTHGTAPCDRLAVQNQPALIETAERFSPWLVSSHSASASVPASSPPSGSRSPDSAAARCC